MSEAITAAAVSTLPAPEASPTHKPFSWLKHMLAGAEDKVRDLYERRDEIASGALKLDEEARAVIAIAVKVFNTPFTQRMAGVLNTILAGIDNAAEAVIKADSSSKS
jgi:hypothetical protein